jgi:hypothetical protein
MSLTSYRAAPPRAKSTMAVSGLVLDVIVREIRAFLARFGGDLLSHVFRRSTIGAVALNGRVRNGAGCFAHAMTTKPRKKHAAFVCYRLRLQERDCGNTRFQVRHTCW